MIAALIPMSLFQLSESCLPSANPQTAQCDPGWAPFNFSCYLAFRGDEKIGITGLDAEAFCVSLGGHSASIHSKEENQFVLERIVARFPDQPKWDGYGMQFWIGPARINASTFGNYDGTPLDYDNWAPTEPTNGLGNENCANMFFRQATNVDSTWQDYPCDLEGMLMRGGVCKKPGR